MAGATRAARAVRGPGSPVSLRPDDSPAAPRRRQRPARERVAILGAALLLAAAPAGARAAAGDAAAGQEEEPLADEIVRHDRDTERRLLGLWGAGVSEEQVVSFSIGMIVAELPRSFDCSTTCRFTGPYAKLEPGLGAGKLSVGRASLVGEQRGSDGFVSHVFFGYGVRASLMRTWSDRSSETPGQLWLGVEADLTAVMVRFNLGLFRHVSGDADDGWLVAAGLGLGF